MAGITLVQTVQGNGGGYVNSYTKSITLTAGNFLTIELASGAADTITITDNKGDTIVVAKDQILTSQRQSQIVEMYNVTGGATTITVTANSGQYPDTAIIIQEWSGMPTTPNPLDQVLGTNVTSGTSYASGNMPTSTQAYELLIAALACDSNAPGFTGDAAWSNLITQAGFDLYTSITTQYRIVSAIGAYNWTVTNGSSRQASMALAGFKGIPLSIPNQAYFQRQAVKRASIF